MISPFERTCILIGDGAIEKLQNARVAIFGVGGVGGFIAEALARSSVGSIDLDTSVCESKNGTPREVSSSCPSRYAS